MAFLVTVVVVLFVIGYQVFMAERTRKKKLRDQQMKFKSPQDDYTRPWNRS